MSDEIEIIDFTEEHLIQEKFRNENPIEYIEKFYIKKYCIIVLKNNFKIIGTVKSTNDNSIYLYTLQKKVSKYILKRTSISYNSLNNFFWNDKFLHIINKSDVLYCENATHLDLDDFYKTIKELKDDEYNHVFFEKWEIIS